MLNNLFWNNKIVLLTGHTGFKGSWLVILLKMLGAKVHGFSLDVPTNPSFYDQSKFSDLLDSDVRGDVGNLDQFETFYNHVKPHVILHLAAQPLVLKSFIDPVETFRSNVMGTVNILESIRKNRLGLESCLIVTTDKCYKNNEWVWGYRENEPLGGKDPYSASKACAELVSAAYRESFFKPINLPVATARAGNVIGGGDYAVDRIVPDIIRAIESNNDIALRNPKAIRPWQHVIEPLIGYLLLVEKMSDDPSVGDAFNFGPSAASEKDVKFVTDYFLKRWGTSIKSNTPNKTVVHEAQILKLDTQKSKNILNWSPYLTLAQSLDLTVDWYKAAIQGENMINYTEHQIAGYLKRDF